MDTAANAGGRPDDFNECQIAKARIEPLDTECDVARPIHTKRTGTLQATTGAPSSDSDLRVVHAVQVGDQARPGWLPVQLLLRECAGGRHVTPGEVRKPAEVCLSLLGLDAD